MSTHVTMVNAADNLVTIKELSFNRAERLIYDNINIDVPRGKVVAIMGPSGCGKTTLLKLIGKQLDPSSGTINIDGKNIANLSRKELFQLRQRMGMLFQSGALFTDLTVFENVEFPLKIHTKLPRRMRRDIVLMKLESVGLRGAKYLYPQELSGGMTRRVALARTIVLDPVLIMYDEPFVGQDPIAMGVITSLIHKVSQLNGITSIIVSHDRRETSFIADIIYLISEGKIIQHGTPSEINNSTNPEVKQFMKGMPNGPVPFHFPGTDYATDLLTP